MRKIRYILIPLIALSILLAPISPVFEKQDGQLAVETKINKAEAVDKALDLVLKKEYTLLVNPTAFLAQARTAVFL